MSITPSFKKSLIVEQLQGNDLKKKNYILFDNITYPAINYC